MMQGVLRMGVKRVINGVHVVPMGMANAFLIEGDDGLTLIDAGYPGKEAAVFGAIRGLGRSPDQLKHLIFTHGHPESYRQCRCDRPGNRCEDLYAPTRYPHGRKRRSVSAPDGGAWSVHPDERLEPVAIDQPLTVGEMLPIAGGIEVIHTPGHSAGHVSLLWPRGRILFVGDVYMNLMGLGDPVGFENSE